MFVPYITPRRVSKLNPRARGGSGKHGSDSRPGKGDGGGGPPDNTTSPDSVNFPDGRPRIASPFSSGGGSASAIPEGLPFAGRQQGGGTRQQVYGTSVYGSGYPNISERGVEGRGFPFYFWPISSWGVGTGLAYLHTQEYGNPENTSRPGGPIFQAAFVSDSDTVANSTFRIVADNFTVYSLLVDLRMFCYPLQYNESLGSFGITAPVPIILPLGSTGLDPGPQNVIQYYRASSVALTLDGYNNTAVFSDDGDVNLLPAPLPQCMDDKFKDCLNRTIGDWVPLVDGYLNAIANDNGVLGAGTTGRSGVGIGLMWVVLGILFGF
ncbi:hypothetical protein VNI00_009691 [Paramarasmius palmivorus]|uniref:Uncharacterized protein n=1 Tax=Paramarasmius palmivorus TaxID=297713 RepID=A0AAW0CNX4_9AGAR